MKSAWPSLLGVDPDSLRGMVSWGLGGQRLPDMQEGDRDVRVQSEDGQISHTHSVSAGLDYPGVGPEHSWLKDIGRVQYVSASDAQAIDAFHTLTRIEGIIPALESSHAIAHAMQLAGQLRKEDIIVVNLSGRGDKDMNSVAEYDGVEL